MRILQGTRVIDAPADWRQRLRADGRPIVLDLGAGDGRYAYESARHDPGTLFVAVDPDAAALGEYAYRASRKPARGGVENALFAVAAVEALPDELLGLAARVRVNFPWGSLLRGLLEPQPAMLDALLSLAAPAGTIEIVMSYDPAHDTSAFTGPAMPPLDAAHVDSVMLPAYKAAGLRVTEQRRLTRDEALAIPSTWGRRLLHARPRDVIWLAAVPDAGSIG